MVRHSTGRGTALYGSWYGTLRVVVRRVSISIEHRDTETQRNLFLSVLIRVIRALRIGGCNRRTRHGVSLLLYSEMKLKFIVTIFSRGCISGGYNEDTEILKLTEKGG